MKILQVNKYYYPVVGGVETVCKQYSEHLSENHDVTVLCVNRGFSLLTKFEKVDGVDVIRCSSIGTLFSMPISLTFIFYFFVNYIRSELVFLHLPFPLGDLSFSLASFFDKKNKLISVWHSDIVKQSLLKRILNPILSRTIKKSGRVILTSPNMYDYSSLLTSNLDERRAVVVPLSVDREGIIGSPRRCPFGYEEFLDDGFDFLFFGRLCYYKGVDVLIDALKILKGRGSVYKVVVAGEGDYANYIRDELLNHGLDNVVFIQRFLNDAEKYWLLDQSKCFVFPSVERSEAFGITQLEAMAFGTPVINTNLDSGVPWVSSHMVTGLTVEPNNPEQLSDAFEKIILSDDLRFQLGSSAVQRVKNCFDDRIVFSKLDFLVDTFHVNN